jgi:hypothetical protein
MTYRPRLRDRTTSAPSFQIRLMKNMRAALYLALATSLASAVSEWRRVASTPLALTHDSTRGSFRTDLISPFYAPLRSRRTALGKHSLGRSKAPGQGIAKAPNDVCKPSISNNQSTTLLIVLEHSRVMATGGWRCSSVIKQSR